MAVGLLAKWVRGPSYLIMAHSSISRTTRFQREKLGALPGWATKFRGKVWGNWNTLSSRSWLSRKVGAIHVGLKNPYGFESHHSKN
jgi:hypothetical protein